MARRPGNEAEARAVLDAHVAGLRSRSYDELRRRIPPVKGRLGFLSRYAGPLEELSEATGQSGALYNLLTQVFWDDTEGGAIRVMVELQEDAKPHGMLTEDFIKAPDGTFVDE